MVAGEPLKPLALEGRQSAHDEFPFAIAERHSMHFCCVQRVASSVRKELAVLRPIVGLATDACALHANDPVERRRLTCARCLAKGTCNLKRQCVAPVPGTVEQTLYFILGQRVALGNICL